MARFAGDFEALDYPRCSVCGEAKKSVRWVSIYGIRERLCFFCECEAKQIESKTGNVRVLGFFKSLIRRIWRTCRTR